MYALGHAGYHLQEKFSFKNSIEFFLGRSFLFPAFASRYSHLTNWFSVACGIGAIWITLRLPDLKTRKMCMLVLIAFAINILAVAITRPGLSHFLHHYDTATSFPQYFLAQNWLTTIWLAIIVSSFKNHILRVACVLVFLTNAVIHTANMRKSSPLFVDGMTWKQSLCFSAQNPEAAYVKAMSTTEIGEKRFLQQKQYAKLEYIPVEIYKPKNTFFYYFVSKDRLDEIRKGC